MVGSKPQNPGHNSEAGAILLLDPTRTEVDLEMTKMNIAIGLAEARSFENSINLFLRCTPDIPGMYT